MSPIEFALWMNGATGVLGEQPPSPEQWAAIREKLGSVVGRIVADRLLDRADELMKRELADREAKQRHVEAMIQAKQAMSANLALKMDQSAFEALSKVNTTTTTGISGLYHGQIFETTAQPEGLSVTDRLKQVLKMRNTG